MLQRTCIVEVVERLDYNHFFVILVTIVSITMSIIAMKVIYGGRFRTMKVNNLFWLFKRSSIWFQFLPNKRSKPTERMENQKQKSEIIQFWFSFLFYTNPYFTFAKNIYHLNHLISYFHWNLNIVHSQIKSSFLVSLAARTSFVCLI